MGLPSLIFFYLYVNFIVIIIIRHIYILNLIFNINEVNSLKNKNV